MGEKPSYQQYRRREKIRPRFLVTLIVYACVVGAIVIFLVQFLGEYQNLSK